MSIRFSAVLLAIVVWRPLAAQPIPFEICAESTTWVWPSPEVQAQIWNDGRYKDVAGTAYEWTHNVLVVLDPESTNEFGDLNNLSGIWTAEPGEVIGRCSSTGNRRSGFERIEVWVLLHRVKEIRHQNNTYTITVESLGKGFQSVMFRRLNPSVVLRFVTTDGTDLDKWDESAPPILQYRAARCSYRGTKGRGYSEITRVSHCVISRGQVGNLGKMFWETIPTV